VLLGGTFAGATIACRNARERIAAQVLISPDAEAVFEIHVGDWFGSTQHEGAINIAGHRQDEGAGDLVHGADEGADSFCQALAGKPNVRQLDYPAGIATASRLVRASTKRCRRVGRPILRIDIPQTLRGRSIRRRRAFRR
jgi:hypothetical protein